MATTALDPRLEPVTTSHSGLHGPGVSWGSIFAGAVAAASLSLILLVLGVGLGLSSVSPWARDGVSATTFGVSTILWITFTGLASSGIGGYIAGRLRTRWVGTHVDEVYFRDTAHGFVAWGVATLITAAVLTSAIGSILGTTLQAAGSVAGAAGTTAMAAAGGAAATTARTSSNNSASSYFTDSLFRKDASAAPAPQANDSSSNAEAATIVAQSVRAGTMAPEDSRYLGQLVAQRTGLSQQDAEKRVNDTFAKVQAAAADAATRAKDAADQARKASAYASLWLFFSLLLGAFAASLAATFGGRQRDLI